MIQTASAFKPDSLELKQMKQYGEKGSRTAYEEDHLIPAQARRRPEEP
jgi:hypothetical protein